MAKNDLRAWAEIDLNALHQNVRSLQAFLGPEMQIMAVVKADGYGHGIVPAAQTAVEAGAEWLGVATVQEGILLRQAGLSVPIVLLCHPLPAQMKTLLLRDLTPTIGDRETLSALIAASRLFSRKPSVHLEIDTGIGRSGISSDEAIALWQEAVEAGISVTGLCTHFSDASGEEEAFSKQQREMFLRTRAALERAGAVFEAIHLSNSPATLRFPQVCATLVRPGLLLYGIQPENAPSGLFPFHPVLTLKTRVVTVRELPAGHPISYGVTHRLIRPSRVATILIGYGDGYPRRLSNNGDVLIKGQRAPILGRVCMDQTVVDVTDIPGVVPGEEVVCIGRQGDAHIPVEEIARRIETTEHEITTCLTPRIPRVYLPVQS